MQTIAQNRSRRTVQFERRPSQRYARRQSHILKERQKPIVEPVPIKASPSTSPIVKETKAKETRNDVDADLLLPDERRSGASSPAVNGPGSASPPETPRSRSTPSLIQVEVEPPPSPREDPLDSLIKSIEKETMFGTEGTETDNGIQQLTEPDLNVVPNNQTKYVSLPKTLPPDQLKCNIWKARIDEELRKVPRGIDSYVVKLKRYWKNEN